jgi:predicted PP-loop superfamily ATPase
MTTTRSLTRRQDEETTRADIAFSGGGDESTTADVLRVPQPIFSFVSAPKISTFAHDELIEWQKARVEYEHAMSERCKDGKEDVSTVMLSIKSSIEDDHLETLCEVRWCVSKSDLTDEFILDKIKEETDCFKNQVLPPVNELFKNKLVMNMNNEDINARVTEYFHLCNTLIRSNGLSAFFQTPAGTKKKCKILVSSLPRNLKRKVENEIEYRCPEAEGNIMKLCSLMN